MRAGRIRRRIIGAIIITNLALIGYSALRVLLTPEALSETLGLKKVPRGNSASLVVTLDPIGAGVYELDRLSEAEFLKPLSVTVVLPPGSASYKPLPSRWPKFNIVEKTAADSPTVPFRWNTWYLLDSAGRLTRRGDLIGDGLVGTVAGDLGGLDGKTVALMRFAASVEAPSYLVPSGGADTGRVVMFLRRGGSACPIAKILRLLNEQGHLLDNRNVSIALPSDFSDGDVSAFIDTYRPVMAAWRVPVPVERRWLELETTYGEPAFGAFVAIYDKGGNVTVLTDPSAVVHALGGA